MRSAKRFSLILLLTLFAIIIAACGAPAAPAAAPTAAVAVAATAAPAEAAPTAAPAEAAAPTAAAPPASDKPINLVYWVTPEIKDVVGMEDTTKEFGDYEKIQAAEYMKLHPNIVIDVQSLSAEDLTKKVTAAIASGTPPDLLKDYVGRTSGYAYQGLLEDFLPVLPKQELDDYDPSYIKMYTINGQLHGLPLYAWTVHLVVNRAIWESAGKADLLPKEGEGSWTYTQFTAAMQAVAQPGKVWPWWGQFASEQGDYCNYGFLWGKGAFVYNAGDYSKVVANTPAGVAGLTFLADMAKNEIMEPGSTTIALSERDNMVGKGQAAAWCDSLYAFQWVPQAEKEGKFSVPVKLQVLQFPHEEGLKSPMPVGPTGFVVFKQTDPDKRTAAMDFARWLNTPEFQRVNAANAKQFPTRKSTGNPLENDANYKMVQGWMAENGLVDLGLASPVYYKVRVAAVPHLQAAILGEKTPAEALKDFENDANAIINTK